VSVPARIRAYVQEHGLARPGDRLVLGVSGGPDSLCLLDVLTGMAVDWGLSLHVACLDHGLRAEARAEVGFVRQEAEARGWPFHAEAVDTRAHAARGRRSLEEAARELRYDFLRRTALAAGAALIAVAHTADDQAETVLMHFLRGSGLAGLKGMLPRVEMGDWRLGDETDQPLAPHLHLIRPLLTISRADVEAYCAERGLRPIHDPSNDDAAIYRNRLRHELLPQLETYNPSIREVLRRAAEVAAGEHALVQALAADLWRRLARADGGEVEFDRPGWLALSVPEQRLLLREAVHRLLPGRRDVDLAPIAQAVAFSRTATPGRSCDVLGGLRFKVTARAVVLSPWGYQAEPADVPLLADDGALTPPWRFEAAALPSGAPDADLAAGADPWRAVVDADTLPAGEWRLRARRPGDRFQPLGLGGHSAKLSDFLINSKVDEALRDRWPLAARGDEIVWVAGLRLDERYRVTAATRHAVRLRLFKTESAA
jgi:tRNA(Ile)-lysidine synthase